MMGHGHVADRIAVTLVLTALVLAGVGVGAFGSAAATQQADAVRPIEDFSGDRAAQFAFPIDNVTARIDSSALAFPIDNLTSMRVSAGIPSDAPTWTRDMSPHALALGQDMDPYALALEQDMDPY